MATHLSKAHCAQPDVSGALAEPQLPRLLSRTPSALPGMASIPPLIQVRGVRPGCSPQPVGRSSCRRCSSRMHAWRQGAGLLNARGGMKGRAWGQGQTQPGNKGLALALPMRNLSTAGCDSMR